MTAVVVNLSLNIADDGMHTPDVVVLSALSVTEDTGGISLGNASQTDGKLCSMIGEQKITAVGSEGFQRLDGSSGGKASGQLIPTMTNTYAVAHHPAGRLALNIEVVNIGGSKKDTLTGIHVVTLKPFGSSILICRARGIVVGKKHGYFRPTLLSLIGDEEAYGLSLRHSPISETGLDSVRDINVGRSFLDEVTGLRTLELYNVGIVFDNLYAGNISCGERPRKCELTCALRIIVAETTDSAFRVGGRAGKLDVAAGGHYHNQ